MVEREFDGVNENKYEVVKSLANKPNQNDINNDEIDTNTDTFEEFSSNTTLHGVRFIGDHTSVLPRRLIWLGVVLLSASLFTIQVVDRVTYYRQSPITVNFKVNYNKSLTFPSVTICNQNLFRVTAAYEKGLDHIIEEMFGVSEVSENMTESDYGMTLDDLYTQLAHTKEDLIVKCYWGNTECSPVNFTTTLTSHGVCYTFNKVDSLDKSLTVEASGIDHGLRLILNTENYEKMNGPHHTDGIKIIATDQSEIPSVEEIGIAISAGAHAFVGVGVLSLNNLEPPYGRCGSVALLSTNRYTPDSCLLECQTKYVVGLCKCRHFYMPNLKGNTRKCNIRDYFNCLQNTLRKFNERKEVICDCPTACVYNIYESSVSYAKKSAWKSTVFGDSIEDSLRQNDINTTFYTANEIKSRMNTIGLNNLQNNLKNTLNYLQGLFSMLYHIGEISQYNQDQISQIHEVTVNSADRRDSLYDFQLFITEKNFIGSRDAMEEKEFGVLCRNYFEFLTDIFHKTKFLLNHNEGTNALITHMLLDGLLTNRINIATMARSSYTRLIKSYELGNSTLNHSYKNFNSSVQSAAIPRELLMDSASNKANVSLLDVNDIDDIMMALYNMELSIDAIYENKAHDIELSDVVSKGKDISDACEVYLDKKRVFYSEVIEKPAVVLKQRQDKLALLKTNYEIAHEMVQGHMENILMAGLYAIEFTIPPLNETLVSALRYINDEQIDNITKFDVAYNLSGSEISLKLRNLEMMLADFKTRLIGFSESLPLLRNRLYQIWDDLLKYEGDNNRFDALMNDWSLSDSISDRGRLLTRILDPMTGQYARASTMIESIDHKTIESIKVVMEKMKDYVESHRMDENFYKENFLEVNVYFKELRSEQIDQQKAYDEFALLCDIGGSMGLFIGGSAITFFEIVDFLILSFVHKLCRKTQ